MIKTLSGRFLILTVLFVMVAEVFIFVPSIARYREDYLLARLERAQIASLALLGSEEMIAEEVEAELLRNAGVLNVVLRRDQARQLVLSGPVPGPVTFTVDLRDASAWMLIRDALRRITKPEQEIIRVIGVPVQMGGVQIEVAMDAQHLHRALVDYGLNILVLSLVISVITAGLLFFAVQRFLVRPIKMLVSDMDRFAEAPEDARQIVAPSSNVRELRAAEEALYSMETQLSQSLKQRERLAQLGEAVAKISHDLRNILTTATLLGDRLENVDDPTVQRVAPRLVRALGRAVALTEGTLAFGRAQEAPPQLARVSLRRMCQEVVEAEQLAVEGCEVAITCEIPPAMEVRADADQMSRVLQNLVRNARQAIQATGQDGAIYVSAEEAEKSWCIQVRDTGPGMPPKAQENLFKAFQSTAKQGGTGLGLTIAAELVRGHGGTLTLVQSDAEGTVFEIELPKSQVTETV